MDARRGKVTDITDLPNDLFFQILSYLSPQDSILCRRVSRSWYHTFAHHDVCYDLMRWHFPRSREFRNASSQPAAPHQQRDWTATYGITARRYHYLRAAKPREIEKLEVYEQKGPGGQHYGVAPWNRVLRWDDKTSIFQHPDPTWCLNDGLLIYPEPTGSYVAYDLDLGQRYAIPFDPSGKTVRRIRLAHGILIIEWCERESYHQLNDRETVHRHFATAFDVRCTALDAGRLAPRASDWDSQRTSPRPAWRISFRSEWKIHFLGLPLNRRDRFFSAHTATHYAIYLWQPNRSPWGEEDPLEQLTIWDISEASVYRPSSDPTGSQIPGPGSGPAVIRRLSWQELDFLGIRQRNTPSLREILLDESNVYVHEEEHKWLAGQHSSLSPPRHHQVRCTGIPFSGLGPKWFDECCADGDVHMSFCPRTGGSATRLGRTLDTVVANPASGTAPSASMIWPGWAPCWRHEDFPYLSVAEMLDVKAGVRVVARQCFMMEALSAFVLPKLSIEEERADYSSKAGGCMPRDDGADGEIRFADDMWGQLLAKGKLEGDERWVVGEDTNGIITIARF